MKMRRIVYVFIQKCVIINVHYLSIGQLSM